MKHVSTIKKIIADGDYNEAYEALDNLLALGPNNIEALKLQAMLYHSEGRLVEEAGVWHKVLTVDREDEDGIMYLLKQQNEDREHYYFTDDIPGGGRRYLAYPRSLITTSFIGLMGCICFLFISRLTDKYPELGETEIILTNFGLLVIVPWIAIVAAYMRALKSVTITKTGIEVSTRLRTVKHKWADFSRVCLTHSQDTEYPDMQLVMVPRDREKPAICLDMNDASSSLRARGHFLREVQTHVKDFSREAFIKLGLTKSNTLRF